MLSLRILVWDTLKLLIMNKLLRSINGLFYTISSIKIFDPENEFSGKKVAVVGPADSAFEVQNGKKIDAFDFVIRINKAPGTWNPDNEKFLGSKTDIWFHSFFENKVSGGGPLTHDIFETRRISKIINPRTTLDAYRRTFNFFRNTVNLKIRVFITCQTISITK